MEQNISNVILYTTPVCVYCKMTKAFLQERNIPYEEKDVTSDAALRQEMVEKSGQLGVPVIDVDGKIMVGFDKGHLMKLLGLA